MTFTFTFTFNILACLALPCFFTLSYKRHDFRNRFEHNMWVLTFSVSVCETFLTLTEIQLFITNVRRPSLQVSVIFVTFYPNLNFLDRFFF